MVFNATSNSRLAVFPGTVISLELAPVAAGGRRVLLRHVHGDPCTRRRIDGRPQANEDLLVVLARVGAAWVGVLRVPEGSSW